MNVIVYYKAIQNGKPQHIVVVSNVLTHNDTTVEMNLNKALCKIQSLHASFTTLKSISVWADSGSHYIWNCGILLLCL